jgi:Vitamin B12 dependent methionine synthase, activation domain
VDTTVLTRSEITLSLDELARRLHVRSDSAQRPELAELVEEASRIARPKAIGGIAYVDQRGDDFIVVDGIRFDSRILAINLAKTHRVFPYVATSGVELDAWAESLDDLLHRFWSEAIREAALRVAIGAMTDWVDVTFEPGQTARMNPGSLPDWPLQQQAPVFRLFGDVESQIGVQLTESMLMVPSKSVSGIRFGTSDAFENCMLCPREDCPGRRSPYDAGLLARRFAGARTRV